MAGWEELGRGGTRMLPFSFLLPLLCLFSALQAVTSSALGAPSYGGGL